MMTTVAGDENAIGYISLGSLDDTVKAVKIDGVEATVDNVSNDSYKIARPFNILTSDKESDAAKDFVNYIMSSDGQKIVEDNGYIKEARYLTIGRIMDSYWLYFVKRSAVKSGSPPMWWI
mgnify:CR=1 FL=1